VQGAAPDALERTRPPGYFTIRKCRGRSQERESELTRSRLADESEDDASRLREPVRDRLAVWAGLVESNDHTVLSPLRLVCQTVGFALVKPMPGSPLAPCLAESWSTSADGLTYEFVLRKGVKFHNGDPVAAEDVKFSFERYKGAAAKTLKDRVVAVEVVDPQRVRFRLKRPWPDFMTFYGTPATGAGWIVPKRYVEQVGDDGFKKAPIGAGPYKFVSFKPGVELILEANEQFWRKTPSVKTLVMRSVPDESTRLAMLKRSEADVAYAFRGPLAEEIRRSPGLTLKPFYPPVPFWLVFTEQWDPKSPWTDRRVRLAANLAIDRQAHQSGRNPGPLETHRQHHPAKLRGLLVGPALPVRRSEGEAAAGGGRVSQWLRCRHDLRGHRVRIDRRGGSQLLPSGGDPRDGPPPGAGGIFQGVPGEAAQAHHPERERGLRQRGDPARRVRGVGRPLHLWSLSRH